ncbi:hypothetical protein ACXN5S_19515 [Pseudoroseicyclus sp. H15]
MSRHVTGVRKVQRQLEQLKAKMPGDVARVNRGIADDWARVSRVLHPGDGETKAQIRVTDVPEANGALIDFGDKAKVTEGQRGPRPFINPAKTVMRKRWKARVRRAQKKVVRQVFGG